MATEVCLGGGWGLGGSGDLHRFKKKEGRKTEVFLILKKHKHGKKIQQHEPKKNLKVINKESMALSNISVKIC